ncbi:lysine N(6)-hydroxylase/L-ornithine N(5)-oxygenase family protein [Ochrobactrum chromiisoli]|uniref:SidA/IucD/PvdA family monooxygenase n=1 Tax=Ochrobactrum chromiisoli TaxID=2993941 RepID=A0ABT3QT76_9HYPH|nr:SidA/IucD/PvdA family monooxygenase [Ochrobactrum chromiisoli]MCX2698827.1 SidA/IucD/PvdA family monooxygenase [Ochrobactrum chromiisoli]
MTHSILDLCGIGVGPFNLSLAAQLDSVDGIDVEFFDRKPSFDWHPGMMLPGAELQTSFMKDLVTATNPTSPWSFVAYLVAHKRFYEFLNADYSAIPRKEFARYLSWVAGSIQTLNFDRSIREVTFDGNHFRVSLDHDVRMARNLSLGVGLKPYVPEWARAVMGERAFHSSEAVQKMDQLQGKRIVVIGGGQSGAEIFQHLMENRKSDNEISWISRRPNFQPLDDSSFTDEHFTPQYVAQFHSLTEPRRHAIVEHQKLASDGISASTIKAIYQRLYEQRHLENHAVRTVLLPYREVLDLSHDRNSLSIVMRNGLDGSIEMLGADHLIFATGYKFALPDCLSSIEHMLSTAGGKPYRVGADFALDWDGPADRRIFVLNAGRLNHGIAEPQLSLMAWRSAVITNALLNRAHFDLDYPASAICWTHNSITSNEGIALTSG